MSRRTGLTAAVAEAATATMPADPRRVHATARCLVDLLGVALAGASHPAVRAAEGLASDDPAGVTTWHDGRRVRRRDAAMVNATAAHALDFDDVLDRLIGHPSAVVLPALLAVADDTGAEFEEVADAFDTGIQLTATLAAGLGIQEHYSAGYHSSSTVGVVAAAAATGRLAGLSTAQVRNAIGIAASSAGGLRQNFGSDTKPLHIGMAAAAALQAVDLAAAGATADPRALEGPTGYLAVLGGTSDLDYAADLLHAPSVLVTEGLNVKRFPCCYEAQRAADAALQLRDRFDVDDVRRITVTVHPGGTRPLVCPDARTGQDARFSAQYVIAAGLIDGRVDLDSFTDSAVARSMARRLMDRTTVVEAAVPPVGPDGWTDGFAVVAVELADDTRHTVRIDVPAGHARNPLDDAQLAAKATACVRYSGHNDPAQLVSLAFDVDEPGGLARLLRALGARQPRALAS